MPWPGWPSGISAARTCRMFLSSQPERTVSCGTWPGTSSAELAGTGGTSRLLPPLRRLVGAPMRRADGLDADATALRAAYGPRETLGRLVPDLDLGLALKDADDADILTGDAAALAEHWQQPFRIRVVVAADADAEPGSAAGAIPAVA